jgi:hypothetical protein
MSKISKNGIKFPEVKWVPLSNLVEVEVGRDIKNSHVKTMEDTIRDNGFADVIKVFSCDEDGNYPIAESCHRVRSLKDQEATQGLIITLNVKGKTWTIYDYVKSHSHVTSRKNHKLFETIKDDMNRLNGLLTNGVVAGIYSKMMMSHTPLRDGTLMNDTTDELYVEKLLERLKNLVQMHGKRKVSNQFLRRYVYHLWREQSKLLKNKKPDYDKWCNFLEYTLSQVDALCNNNSILSEGDAAFKHWWTNQRSGFVSTSKKA